MGSGGDDLIPMGYTREEWAAASGPSGETIETPTTHGEQPHVVHAEGSRAIVWGCTETTVTVFDTEAIGLAMVFDAVLSKSAIVGPMHIRDAARLAREVAEELGIVTRRRVGRDVEAAEG